MSSVLQHGGGARAVRLSVLVSGSEAAEISRRAEEAGLSVSAYLRAQALGTGVSEGEAEAMAIFDRLLDEMTARVDAANGGLVASLERMDAAKPGSAA
jgi:hypothetical protein